MPAPTATSSRHLVAAALCAAAAAAGALAWTHNNGYSLSYGDAAAHLNIARRLWDSRTPGYEQIGTVWLPLPHWIMAPFTLNDSWWRSGLAGSLPAALFHALAAILLWASARRLFDNLPAAWTAMAAFLANPNALYLGSIPMTEPFFAAAAMALFYCMTRDGPAWAAAAGFAAAAAALVRYEGWFLLPFAALVLLFRKGLRDAAIFSLAASIGPLYWLGHNRFFYGDALEFYRGPYSALAIQGKAPYPGQRDAGAAVLYYRTAVQLAAGWPLAALGAAGAALSTLRGVIWPVALLALSPLFYLLSIHSAGTPVFVPTLWPNSYYNTRYALAALPLLALGVAALVWTVSRPLRTPAALLLSGICALPWLSGPRAEAWICWKESQVNSEARRAWTAAAAAYLKQHYRGGGILTSFGDLTAVFQQAGIPLRETLHEGNSVAWLAAVTHPRFFLRTEWVVAISGDAAATGVVRSWRNGPRYDCVRMVIVKGAPPVEIYRRGSQARLPEAAAEPEDTAQPAEEAPPALRQP